MGRFDDVFPPIDIALELEPEELAVFVLKYLDEQPNINRYNFTLGTNSDMSLYVTDNRQRTVFCERLMEAWMWLEKELLVAPRPGQQGDWAYVTPRGKRVLQEQDFTSYRRGSLLPSDGLDPVLVRKVKPLFIRGDYDLAVFAAFREVEERTRQLSSLTDSDYGRDLMLKAFGPSGKLCDQSSVKSERDAVRELFCGAIGLFKNPTSHRTVEYTNPKEVADIIGTANQLLAILERRKIHNKT